ncbi:MAG: NUDIX hydrolase [Micromonosporaceae bacterium]|jgi:ADP-ribose pyrophosphatase|nr:NUDIX hydrolase [Micromonosporaceae bacterium]
MTDPDEYRVVSRQEQFRGPVFTVVTDQVRMPSGRTVPRDYVEHIGAVGVVALDAHGRVVLVHQYRHPLRDHLWELPAGLVDMDGEAPHATALRELAEEADLYAGRLDLLLDMRTSPGYSTERIRIFLARDLTPVPEADRHERHDEEAGMQARWFDLDEAVRMVFAGEITNGPAVAGLLAAARARDEGWRPLRPTGSA